ncbi:MAG: hypothetical protein J6W14_00280 [Clostridia bacterium]|nr:hypothetical protein [Clostridia bacterium]
MKFAPLFYTSMLDVIVSPWELFWEFFPAVLLVGALVAVVVTITVLLIRRFFGKKK